MEFLNDVTIDLSSTIGVKNPTPNNNSILTKEQVDAAIAANNSSIIESDSLNNFPVVGSSGTIYVAKDTNKIYRNESTELVLPQIPQDSIISITTSISNVDNLQTVINNSQNGDAIFLANGTYLFNQSLTITKEISIVGESQLGVILQDTRGNSQSFISISANNVILKDLTVLHSTTDSSIGHAITVSGGGFPQTRLNNFRLYNVKSKYSKGGLAIRCDNFIIKNCTFEVIGGSSTRRGVLHYGNGGNSFIKNCHFINATTGALRAVCPTSTTGSNPNEVQAGTLTIENSTFTGNLSQFLNIDNHQGTADNFELIIKNNTTPETSAFVVSFGVGNNFGNIFKRIVLIGNTLTNNHASGLGKGAFAIDGTGSISFRSSILPVVAFDNILGQLIFRAGFAEATGSVGSIVGYSSTAIILPSAEISTGSTSVYTELAPKDNDLIPTKSDKIPNSTNIANLPTGGSIGLASATVDIFEWFNIAQTTAGQTVTLPTPTLTTNQKIVYVANTGTASFTMYGSTLAAKTVATLKFDTTLEWLISGGTTAGGGGNSSLQIPNTTSWAAYTPVFTGMGTVASSNFWWRRNGENIEVRGKVVTGTGNGLTATLSLPTGLSISSNFPTNGASLYSWAGNIIWGGGSGVVGWKHWAIARAGDNFISVTHTGNVTNTLNASSNPFTTEPNMQASFYITVPIQGWAAFTAVNSVSQLYQTTSAPLASAIANSVTTVSNIKVRYNANGTGGNLEIACVSGTLTCQMITARQIFNGGLTTNVFAPNALLTTTFTTFTNGGLDGPAEFLDYEIFVSNTELYEVKLRLTGSSGTDLILINLNRIY